MKTYDIDSLENRDPELVDRVYRAIRKPLTRYFRFEARGFERVPPGPGLFVGNHSGGTIAPDFFLFGIALYERYGIAELPYGLAHEVIISLPVFQQIAVPLGAVRASHDCAERLLAQGKKTLVYPGSDFDALRPFRDRYRVVFGNRRGYMRLALRARVPIIPVVTAGSHAMVLVLHDGRRLAKLLRADKLLRSHVWPLMFTLPWGLTLGPMPLYIPMPCRVTMEILEPIRFEQDGPEAAENEGYVRRCAQVVEDRMQTALTALAAERR
jgi:1-acyl-sn-glycerol-3-phosphate acyltransferase